MIGSASISTTASIMRQRLLTAGLLALFVLVSVQYYFKIDNEQRSAILRWRPQIQQLFETNIYERFNYPNPPIMAILLTPIVALPPIAAGLLWFYIKVAMTLFAIHWTFRMIETPDQPFPLAAKILAVLLALRPIMGDLTHGNVNLFILFLVIGCLFAFNRGKDTLAGLALGLAIACKVTPALFVPYFLWKGAWRTLAGTGLGLALFLWVAPSAFLGVERNQVLLTSWYQGMVRPFIVSGEVTTDHLNQSLPGLVYRSITASPSTVTGGRPTEYRNFADVDPSWAKLVVKACMVAFAGLFLWSCRTNTNPRNGWRLAAEYSLVLVGMLLFSERTWKHHCVILLPPFAVISYYLFTESIGRGMRWFLIGSLAAVVLLMTTTSSGVSDAWDRAAKIAHADGAYVWAYLVLIAALVVMLRRTQPARAKSNAPLKPALASPLTTA